MYNYGGYCGYPQPCAPAYGGGYNCNLAIILVLFILLVIAGCGLGCKAECGYGC